MTKSNNSELAFEVLGKFRSIYGSAKNHFRQIEEQCGISGSQLWILKEVASNPNIGITQVSERLSIHQTTCSLLVEKLVKSKLITKERSQEDQRRVGLKVTDEGLAVLAKAPEPVEGILPSAVNAMDKESLDKLNKALNLLIAELDGYDNQLANKPLADI
jgi:MarR family transcriptional regulator, organic hydroperoxide resistance regulator